jgi:hypothetical protein
MLSDALVRELRKLNRADKLRAMQVLVIELSAEEEAWLIPGATYEIVTPYGNEAAAQVLSDMLETAKAADKKAES